MVVNILEIDNVLWLDCEFSVYEVQHVYIGLQRLVLQNNRSIIFQMYNNGYIGTVIVIK